MAARHSPPLRNKARVGEAMRFPIVGKLLALAGVMLLLLGSLGLVGDVVAERQGRLHEAQRGIADSLAAAQVIAGPVLQRQCSEEWKVSQGEGKARRWVDERRDLTLAAVPHRLAVTASSRIEPRTRGIFRINGYVVQASLKADWTDLQALQPAAPKPGVTQRCDAPVLWVAVADPRGIRTATVSLAGSEAAVRPGTPAANLPRGFQATGSAGQALDATAAFGAVVTLELVGTEDLAFAPIGEQSVVKLSSDWPHPSFNGRFLPSQRTVSDQGFEAEWQLSALASRSGPELLAGGGLCAGGDMAAASAQPARACIERFGVAFIDPVSSYVLGDRATKYGLLFIVLTFVAVGLVEVMRQLRVHPVQYALVGAALALFFLLLVSLSEHVGFGRAYAAAATACTLLLGHYGAHVLRGWRAGAVFAGGIGGLYAMLYLLLLSEQSALVLGSVLLFAVLAAVMVVTRRIDWYALTARLRSEAQPAPATTA